MPGPAVAAQEFDLHSVVQDQFDDRADIADANRRIVWLASTTTVSSNSGRRVPVTLSGTTREIGTVHRKSMQFE